MYPQTAGRCEWVSSCPLDCEQLGFWGMERHCFMQDNWMWIGWCFGTWCEPDAFLGAWSRWKSNSILGASRTAVNLIRSLVHDVNLIRCSMLRNPVWTLNRCSLLIGTFFKHSTRLGNQQQHRERFQIHSVQMYNRWNHLHGDCIYNVLRP